MTLETIETVLLVLLVTDAIALGVLVLLQQGKGADVGAAFGSGGANTVFGGQGSASFLTRATTWLSVGFFVISFGLAYTAKERAAAMGNLGIPTVVEEAIELAPVDPLGGDVPALDAGAPGDDDVPDVNPTSDAVDSDVPDV